MAKCIKFVIGTEYLIAYHLSYILRLFALPAFQMRKKNVNNYIMYHSSQTFNIYRIQQFSKWWFGSIQQYFWWNFSTFYYPLYKNKLMVEGIWRFFEISMLCPSFQLFILWFVLLFLGILFGLILGVHYRWPFSFDSVWSFLD